MGNPKRGVIKTGQPTNLPLGIAGHDDEDRLGEAADVRYGGPVDRRHILWRKQRQPLPDLSVPEQLRDCASLLHLRPEPAVLLLHRAKLRF